MSVQRRKDSKGRVLKNGESQRKDGSYMYRYTDTSGNRKSAYAPDLNALREKEDEIQKALSCGIDFDNGNITVMEFLKIYLSQKCAIRSTTEQSYRKILVSVEPYTLSRLRVNQVKLVDAKAFVIELSRDGKKYSTIQTYKSFIKYAFDMACEENLIVKNPFLFPLKKVIVNNTVKKAALTKSQQESFLEYVHESNIYRKHEDDICILLGTGLRIGELYGLTVKDVDFKNNCIYVNHQLVWLCDRRNNIKRMAKIHKPKTAAGIRTIPMTKNVADCFRHVIMTRNQLAQILEVDGYKDFVFATDFGLESADNFSKALKNIVNAYNRLHPNEPQLPHVSPHILRHTFCTNMINYGMNIKTVQYLMGHSSVQMTLEVYTHANQENVISDFANIMNKCESECDDMHPAV